MHICPDEIAAIATAVQQGPATVYSFCSYHLGRFCRWCARLIRR